MTFQRDAAQRIHGHHTHLVGLADVFKLDDLGGHPGAVTSYESAISARVSRFVLAEARRLAARAFALVWVFPCRYPVFSPSHRFPAGRFQGGAITPFRLPSGHF